MKIDDLERLLFREHRSRQAARATDEWQSRLMRDIRLLGVPGAKPGALAAYNRIAWRYLVPACAVAIILFALAWANGVIDHRDLASTMLENPLVAYLP